jgi:hypothetical protein
LTLLRFLFLSLLLASTSVAQITYNTIGYSPYASEVSTGDFDRDGRPDVAGITFDTNGNASLVIFRGGTGGTLSKKVTYPFDNNFNSAWTYTADINNDDKLDIIVLKEYADSADIWLGNGDATFHFSGTQFLSLGTRSLTLADFNRDGKIDIGAYFEDDTSSGVEVLLGNGDATFVLNGAVEGESGTSGAAIADFNRDGKLDVVLKVGAQFETFRGNGDGTFAAQPIVSAFKNVQGTLIVGSFNRDTTPDLAFRVSKCSTCSTDTIYVLLGDGLGHFNVNATKKVGLSEGIGSLAAGDLNNDGVQDIVFSNNGQAGNSLDHAVLYMLANGDGTFGSQHTAATLPPGVGTPVLRHLNLDSQMDILVPSSKLYTLMATNAPTNCTPPGTSTLAVKICAPTGTTSTSFTVKAAGDSPAGVSRMQLWVDGKKKYDLWADQLRTGITVTPGTHRITVRAYDRYKGSLQKSINITAN